MTPGVALYGQALESVEGQRINLKTLISKERGKSIEEKVKRLRNQRRPYMDRLWNLRGKMKIDRKSEEETKPGAALYGQALESVGGLKCEELVKFNSKEKI